MNYGEPIGVSPQKAVQLLSAVDSKIDEDITDLLDSAVFRAYQLGDGRILIADPSGSELGTIWPSREAFLRVNGDSNTEALAPHHILEDLLPQGKDFALAVNKLIDRLAQDLTIPRKELDGSFKSVDKVEHAIERRGYDNFLNATSFPPLLAYVGEVIRQAMDTGKWRMILDEESNVWEPWIVDSQDNWENPFSLLYDALTEDPEIGSLSGRISAIIDF